MDRHSIQQIKSRLDFVEMVRRYVDLRPVGDRWTGPCPFHQETKPSFHVNPGQGFFYCFGCQASGDAIDFYARINGLDFKESLQQLARETGVELDLAQTSPREKQEREQHQTFLEMYAQSAAYFQDNLARADAGPPAQYLRRRDVSPEMLAAFNIGWSRPDWHGLDNHLRSLGHDREQALACGLLAQNDKGRVYDRFRDRIMFPIHDFSGKIIAFGGRAIDSGEPKYINSSESPIYTKGRHLYGLFQARRSIVRDKRVLLTEGYLDVIALHQFGFTTAVGVLGTAMTTEQAARLNGLSSQVDVIFDGDEAGQKAALRATQMFLALGMRCHVAILPAKEDVDSLLHAHGADALRALLDAAREGLDFCLRTIAKTFAPKDVLGWVRQFLGGITAPELRAYYLPRVATGLGISEAELRRQEWLSPRPTMNNVPGESEGPDPRSDPRSDPRPAPSLGSRNKGSPAGPRGNGPRLTGRDRQLLAFAVNFSEYRGQVEEHLFSSVLETEWARALWAKLHKLGPEHEYSALDEEQRRFCYQQLAEARDRPEDHAALWNEVREFLEKHQARQRQRQMLQDLRQAQMQGDGQRVADLLRAYQDLAMAESNPAHAANPAFPADPR